MKKIVTMLTAAVLSFGIVGSTLQTADAGKRERRVAAGLALGVLGAVIIANSSRDQRRGKVYYDDRNYDDDFYDDDDIYLDDDRDYRRDRRADRRRAERRWAKRQRAERRNERRLRRYDRVRRDEPRIERRVKARKVTPKPKRVVKAKRIRKANKIDRSNPNPAIAYPGESWALGK